MGTLRIPGPSPTEWAQGPGLRLGHGMLVLAKRMAACRHLCAAPRQALSDGLDTHGSKVGRRARGFVRFDLLAERYQGRTDILAFHVRAAGAICHDCVQRWRSNVDLWPSVLQSDKWVAKVRRGGIDMTILRDIAERMARTVVFPRRLPPASGRAALSSRPMPCFALLTGISQVPTQRFSPLSADTSKPA